MKPKPISECTEADLKNGHALVWGRCRIWHLHTFESGPAAVWSRWAWWKAMHYPHRGPPSCHGSWGFYAGGDGHTGPGDAQITHFVHMLENPAGAPTGNGDAIEIIVKG